ncbi:MAG: carboxypeptidase M32 [Clostridia bacterium]|nr:carboxypeptidase M32 [Clostridia bacterium]
MTTTEALKALDALETELRAYNHALGVMNYDAETVAPRNSAPARGETMAFLSGVIHERITAPATGELIDTLLAEKERLSLKDRRRAEVLKEERDDLTLIPADEYMAYQQLLAEAGQVWHDAKLASDYAAYAPFLDRIIAYNRRFAARKDAAKPAYDVLLDSYEKGLTHETLDPFFALLRSELTPVILEVARRPRPDTAFLDKPYPIHLQRRFTDRVMQIMGLNRDDCAVGETEHPFTEGFNKHDVRITTHYHEDSVLSNLFSVVHEGGHALYELGVADDLQGTLLSGGSCMSIHESQSRFYENLIGRSRPFCALLLPELRALFPEQLEGVDAEKLYRAACLAEPSLIRTEADELTYSIHVMIRYELEKAMISGELDTADIPGEWNKMYKAYLGVDVPDDRRGCLQDSHWSFGAIGYFPSYALGSAYGVQMLGQMEKDVDVWGAVRAGDLSPITAWLGEKVHRYGQLLTPSQLVENACGGPFDACHYVNYLKEKYGELYTL